jgi:quercetin dioxygenase-like cupin family protein
MVKEILIDQIVSSIGSKISQLRKQKDLSINHLAEMAGVSVTTVHKLERHEMTPTVTVLMKIANALGEKVGFFLEESNGDFEYIENVEYSDKSKIRVFGTTAGKNKIEYLAVRLRGAKLFGLLIHYKTGAKSGIRKHSHPGEEFIYCLEGQVKHEVNGEVFNLSRGDSLHFFSNLPHRWEVTCREGATMLWITTPPPTGEVTELWK